MTGAALSGGCARRYRVEGLVLAVRPERTLVVAHEAIPGLMPAMAMPFAFPGEEAASKAAPGSRVRFELRVRKGRSETRRLRIVDVRNEGVEDFRFPVPEEQLQQGAEVPDFALTTHTGDTVRLSELRGTWVAINFIYSRCPLPEVCPRLTASFAALRRRFPESRLRLLSITLDPRYDTPEILAAYARATNARWPFLTGPEDTVTGVARRFGLVHWAEEGVIVHSSVTALVTPSGKLAALVEGSGYRLEQLASLVEYHLTRRDDE